MAEHFRGFDLLKAFMDRYESKELPPLSETEMEKLQAKYATV